MSRHPSRHNGATGKPSELKDRSTHDAARGVKASSSPIRTPSRRSPTEEEWDAALDEFAEGPDRVSGVLAAAMVDNTLRDGITSALEDATEEIELFHKEGAPFGTFKQKIVAARALGLISPDLAEDLDLIRDVRNQFAHALLPLTFEDEYIAKKCASLRDYRKEKNKPLENHRMRYEIACYVICNLILQATVANWKRRRNATQAALTGTSLKDLASAGLKSLESVPAASKSGR